MQTFAYTILIHPAEPDEEGFWVEVPALPGCFTQGETVEECLQRAQEAIEGHLEALAKAGQPIPVEQQPTTASLTTVRVNVPAVA